MGIRINRLPYLILLLLIFQFFQQCNCKNGLGIDCSRTVYQFKIDINVKPINDTINVGDTVWFELNTPVNLIDLITGNSINYGGASNLGSALNIRALSASKEYTIEAINKFNYTLKEGILLRMNNDIAEYSFTEKNNSFIFLLGIVAKEKGTYRILFGNAGNVFRNNDKCTKAGFIINIANADRHPYLNPFYLGGVYPEGGDYYFVVK